MHRGIGLLAAGCGLALAACAAPAPATQLASRDQWYALAAPTDVAATPPAIAVNLHRTSLGFAGRIQLANGDVHPVVNIRSSPTALSFMAPAIDATFAGVRDGAGWSGAWTSKGAASTLTLTPGPAPDDHGPRMVALSDGRRMHLVCQGEGSPTVVFDAGSGGTTRDWRLVHTDIARTTRACAYDRAGMGLSDAGPAPRDAAAVARDLDAMLKAARIAGPYVLVGHSLGSFHVRQFANTHPRETAGMVLVDPSGDFQADRFAAASPHFARVTSAEPQIVAMADCAVRAREELIPHGSPRFAACGGNDPVRFETVVSEIRAMTPLSSPELAASRRPYGDMPLIVLTRGDFTKGMPTGVTAEDSAVFRTIWTQMHEEMRALSTIGERREIAGSGHYVQLDRPLAVIAAVNDVVLAARRRAAAAD